MTKRHVFPVPHDKDHFNNVLSVDTSNLSVNRNAETHKTQCTTRKKKHPPIHTKLHLFALNHV